MFSVHTLRVLAPVQELRQILAMEAGGRGLGSLFAGNAQPNCASLTQQGVACSKKIQGEAVGEGEVYQAED